MESKKSFERAKHKVPLLPGSVGGWWQDDRRNWCAYCGIRMRRRKGPSPAPTHASRDHIVPRVPKRRAITIPACRRCNGKKARLPLSDFVKTDYFTAIRARRHPTQWPLEALTAVEAKAFTFLLRQTKPAAGQPMPR